MQVFSDIIVCIAELAPKPISLVVKRLRMDSPSLSKAPLTMKRICRVLIDLGGADHLAHFHNGLHLRHHISWADEVYIGLLHPERLIEHPAQRCLGLLG